VAFLASGYELQGTSQIILHWIISPLSNVCFGFMYRVYYVYFFRKHQHDGFLHLSYQLFPLFQRTVSLVKAAIGAGFRVRLPVA